MSVEFAVRRPCPCCGHLTLDGAEDAEGDYDICLVCFWEDDPDQRANPHLANAANEPSLVAARANYLEFGACERRSLPHVRPPRPDEIPPGGPPS